MGTRSLIVIKNGWDAIVLYKHWDGYPEFMVEYLKGFRKWYEERVKSRPPFYPHFLQQVEDIASGLIAYDWERTKEMEAEYSKKFNYIAFLRPVPDIRPTSISVSDALANGKDCAWEEYVYVINVPTPDSDIGIKPNSDITWTLDIYKVDVNNNRNKMNSIVLS